MTYSERLLEQIGSSVSDQVRREAEQVTAEADGRYERELSMYRDELYDRMYHDMQKQLTEIKRESLRARSRRQAEARRLLLERRRELCDGLFDDVRARLLEYANTEEYRAALLKRIGELKDGYDHSSSTVTLRAEDERLSDEIRGLLPGCSVTAGKDISLGGFILRNEKAGILLNETLDERLRMQRPRFLESCGLKVV